MRILFLFSLISFLFLSPSYSWIQQTASPDTIPHKLTVIGTMTATYFSGDGGGLTNLSVDFSTITTALDGKVDLTETSSVTISNALLVSGEVIVTSSITANDFYGNGSNLTGISGGGDDLGNHIATTTLQMGVYDIQSSTAINAGYFQINGSTVLAILPGITSMAIGIDAGRVDTAAGNFNLFVGQGAGYTSANQDANTCVGYAACNVSGGGYGTFLGYWAGGATTGSFNVMAGAEAGYYQTGGAGNIFIGYKAGYGVYAQPQSYNVAIGHQAGYALSTNGNGNVLLGYQAGNSISTGTYNIIIGYDVDTLAAYTTNYLNIGNAIYGYMNDYSTISVVGAFSATEVIDRTPFPESIQLAYDEVNSMERDVLKPNKLDHKKLHPNLKAKIKEKYIAGYETKIDDNEQEVITPIILEREVEGRRISETISAMAEVIKHLIIRIEVLEK